MSKIRTDCETFFRSESCSSWSEKVEAGESVTVVTLTSDTSFAAHELQLVAGKEVL